MPSQSTFSIRSPCLQAERERIAEKRRRKEENEKRSQVVQKVSVVLSSIQ